MRAVTTSVAAAFFLAAATAGSAQVVVRSVPPAPALAPTALGGAPLLAPAAESAVPSLPAAPALARVLGVPGPGVTPAHIEAVKALAVRTGIPWIVHGSRQTGVSHHTGLPFAPDTDLDLGVVGPPETVVSRAAQRWDGAVPDAKHAPMIAVPTIEEAVGRGHLVVAPPLIRARGELGALQKQAEPWRTAAQLTRLAETPRAKGETFLFAVIGDAEPGRFWFSRMLFGVPGVFWRLLARADAARPDFIFQLGDMVSRGTVANFRAFVRGLFTAGPKAPYLTAIGNHDRHRPHGVTNDRVYRAAFGDTDYYFDRGGRRFVVLDSSAGRVTKEQLAWLASSLDPAIPTIVFTHIPPAPISEWTDWGRVIKGAGGFKEGAAEFMRLMAANKVQRVYMGHIHALGVAERDGVRYVLTGGGGSPLYPGPVKRRLHHWLSVELGPDGPVETVHDAAGGSHPLR